MKKNLNKNLRKRRHMRIRKKIRGNAERPRLNVFRSLKHIYAQIIDDQKGYTLVSSSTLDKELKEAIKGLNKTEAARMVGKRIASLAIEKGIKKVVFDRGGYLYHGRVKALAEGAREGGLEF